MTDKPYVPTTFTVKGQYVGIHDSEEVSHRRSQEFDRWLDQVRAEAKAEALAEAADVFYDNNVIIDGEKYHPCHSCASIAQQYLDHRADQIKEQP